MVLDRYIKNQSYYVLFGNLFAAAFSMCSFMLLTRFLTKQSFGEFETFMAMLVLIEMVFQGLSNNAMVRFLNSYIHRRKEIIGSSWAIRIFLNIVTTILIYSAYFIFKDSIDSSDFRLFFIFCPIFIWSVLPVNMARSVLQSDQNFKLLALTNIFIPISLFIFYIVGYILKVDLMYVVYGNIAFRILLMLVIQFKYGSYISCVKYTSYAIVRKLLGFGKFSILTFLGSSVLKSSDKILIQYFMGAANVANWSVPMKLTELIDNPVRSTASTSYPKMTKMYTEKKYKELSSYLHNIIAKYVIIAIPLSILCMFIPSVFINFLGGAGYENSYIILQVFSFYFLLVPFDRFIGTALSSINKPQYDSIKVSTMAIVNIVGDIIVLIIFKELWPVAVVTLLNISAGIGIGIFYLKKHITDFSIRKILIEGIPNSSKELITMLKIKTNEIFNKKH